MLEKIIDIVGRAGQMVRDAQLEQEQIREKSSAADLVTTYDLAVESFLRQELAAVCPQAGFVGEEAGGDGQEGDWLFIVDPIDGTANFARDYAHSNISVALANRGVVEYGVVYDPYRQEMFSAQRGKGAYLNGRAIHVSDRDAAHGLYLIGSAPYRRDLADWTFAAGRKLYERMADFRRLAAAALDFCYVACGRAELYYEGSLRPWDYAAGMLIVREAGGVACTLAGEELPLKGSSSAFASNGRCCGLRDEIV